MLARLQMPIEVFQVECLRPVERRDSSDLFNADLFSQGPPFYEQYGERQVAAGYYQQVLRYGDHFLPLAAALAAHVIGKGSGATCAS